MESFGPYLPPIATQFPPPYEPVPETTDNRGFTPRSLLENKLNTIFTEGRMRSRYCFILLSRNVACHASVSAFPDCGILSPYLKRTRNRMRPVPGGRARTMNTKELVKEAHTLPCTSKTRQRCVAHDIYTHLCSWHWQK